MAVRNPCDCVSGCGVPPMYWLPGTLRNFASSFVVKHQSTVGTYNRFVCAFQAGPFHWTPPSVPGQ